MAAREPPLRCEASSGQIPAGVLLPPLQGRAAIRAPRVAGTSPLQPPSFACSFLSPCTDVSPHKTHPPAATRPPTSPHAHPGMATAPCSPPPAAAPHPTMGSTTYSGERGWEEGSHGRCPRGRGRESHPWLFIVPFPSPMPLSLQRRSETGSHLPLAPAVKGGPWAAPHPCPGCRGEATLCQVLLQRSRKDKNYCQGGWRRLCFMPQAGNEAANSPCPHATHPISSHRHILGRP